MALLRSISALFLISSLCSSFAYAVEMKDLGFAETEMKASPELQKTLEDRRFYLRQHQIWGLVTVGALAATVLSGGEGDLPPEHPFFAGLAVASYAATAYTAWKAPELPYGEKRGGSAWHRRLIWVHLPAMIAAPILGYMAAKKYDRGDKLDSPEKYHKDVAYVAAGAVALSALSVSIEF